MNKRAAFVFLMFFLFVIFSADRGTLPAWLRAFYDFPGGDWLGHAFLYGGLTFFLARAFPRRWSLGPVAPAFVSLGAAGVALVEELSQFAFPLRSPSLFDLLLGLLGIALADWLAAAWRTEPA